MDSQEVTGLPSIIWFFFKAKNGEITKTKKELRASGIKLLFVFVLFLFFFVGQESPGKHWKALESLGKPWKAQKAPGSP